MKTIMLAALAGTALFVASGNASDTPAPGARSDASRLFCQYVTRRVCVWNKSHTRGRCTFKRVPVSCTGEPDTGKK